MYRGLFCGRYRRNKRDLTEMISRLWGPTWTKPGMMAMKTEVVIKDKVS